MSDQSRHAVVVGFDGSMSARTAATWAAREAASANRPLWLAYAFRWPLPELRDLDIAASTGLEAHAREAATTGLDAAVRRCKQLAPGLDVHTRLVDGNAVEALTKLTTEAELLVLGTCGQSGIPQVLLGSSAAELTRRAACSILVVRDATDRPAAVPSAASLGKRVVIGLDGSPASAAVAQFGFDFAARHHHDLVAVHARFDLPLEALTAMGAPSPDRKRAQRTAEAILASLLAPARQRYPQVPAHHLVTLDRPAQALLTHTTNTALLVVGRHGRAHSREVPLGSVSHAVLHYAHCPVAVVTTR